MLLFFFLLIGRPQRSTLFPYTTLFRSDGSEGDPQSGQGAAGGWWRPGHATLSKCVGPVSVNLPGPAGSQASGGRRSEEHTSELQSRENLVCRLLLEKKKNIFIALI